MNGESRLNICSIGDIVDDKAGMAHGSIIHAALYGGKSGDDSRCNVMLCMDTDGSFRLFRQFSSVFQPSVCFLRSSCGISEPVLWILT